MTDPIADLITRIRNAYAVNKASVVVPYSKQKQAIAEKLMELSYLKQVRVVEEEFKSLELTLSYKGKLPVLSGIKRVSTPGRRVYMKSANLPKVLSGFGSSIVSTSHGILTDKEARAKGIGGEVVCQVW